MSVPTASGPIPAATAAAAPPLDPPGVSDGWRGLRVWPCTRFDVNQRSANVGELVRPSRIAPAFLRLPTTGLSACAIRFSCRRVPLVVAKPAWSTLIFTVTGTPESGPGSSPRAIARSTSSA